MKTKLLYSLLLLILIINSHLLGKVQLSKIYISNTGQLEKMKITVNSFNIYLNHKGQVQDFAIETNGNIEYDYRIQDNNLEKINNDELNYRFENVTVKNGDSTNGNIKYVIKERLYSLAGELIEYFPLYPDRIRKIGDLEFKYYLTGKGMELIKYIDNIYFDYRYPDNRIENIGNASFIYFYNHNDKIRQIMGCISETDNIIIYIPSDLNLY